MTGPCCALGRSFIESLSLGSRTRFLTVHLPGVVFFSQSSRSCIDANGQLLTERVDETAGCGGEVTTDERHRRGAFVLVHDAATEGLRMVDEARTVGWHDNLMGGFQDRDWNGAPCADQTSSGCEVTTDLLSVAPHATPAGRCGRFADHLACCTASNIESTAAVEADSPISWRAAALPITESATASSNEPAPGAAAGIAATNASTEPTSRSALAHRAGATTSTKRPWPIFYGLVAVLILVDVIVVWLAYRA
jgi:hypothetical protein